MNGKMIMRLTVTMEYETFAPSLFTAGEAAALDENIFKSHSEIIPIMMKKYGGIIHVSQSKQEEEE
jgi:hypothetical protein